MQLVLKRIALRKTYTIGHLYINGKYFCDTCEDRVRPAGEKVDGETAIPYGKYCVKITWSPRFRKRLPLIENVPNFTGIRIHSGNAAKDSRGCVLVGRNTVVGGVTKSRVTMTALMAKLETEPNNIIIEIV